MELISFNKIAMYFPVSYSQGQNINSQLYNEGNILIREFEDKCDFGYFYNSQQKRELFSLNLNNKLILVVNKHVFIYDLESNSMTWNSILKENHKGGSLVYVPKHNLVYCISGIVSSFVETIDIFNDPNYEINKCENYLAEPRAYFATYIQNENKIFVILGYNYMKNDFMTTIEKLDITLPDKTWKELFFNNEFTVPKLVFISCIPTSHDKIHILGGVDENFFINRTIYVISLSSNSFEIESTNMALPLEQEDQKIVIAWDNNKGFSCLFYQENCFIPLQIPVGDNGPYLYGLYDSKHNLHITNLYNFNYCIISRKEEKPNIIRNAIHVSNAYSKNNNNEIKEIENAKANDKKGEYIDDLTRANLNLFLKNTQNQ